jgi:hypothetical protein
VIWGFYDSENGFILHGARSPASMGMRRRGELRGVQQNADRGIASVDGGDVRLAVVSEIGDDQLIGADSDAKLHRRLECAVAIAKQYRDVARFRIAIVRDR